MNKTDKKNVVLSIVFSISMILFGIAFARILIRFI